MKNEREYLAYADNGRDYIEFTFYSTHRANSKDNKSDAESHYRRRHGKSVRILSTRLQ